MAILWNWGRLLRNTSTHACSGGLPSTFLLTAHRPRISAQCTVGTISMVKLMRSLLDVKVRVLIQREMCEVGTPVAAAGWANKLQAGHESSHVAAVSEPKAC